MAQSLAKLYVHAIFSTKNRVACLEPGIRSELYSYLAEVLSGLKCPAIEIGGVGDHLHVLCTMAKGIDAEDLIKGIKTPTSAWVKRRWPAMRDFYWQGGYGIFSVSPSNLPKVRQYIAMPEEHHRRVSFQEEFRRFLKRYQVEYDERYVWE